MRRCLALMLGAALLVQLGGCGGTEEETSTLPAGLPIPDTAAPKKHAPDTPVQAHTGDWAELKKVAGKYSERLLIPRGPSPERVVIRNLKEGTGPTIEPGDIIVARYVSFHYATAKVAEPYWKRPTSPVPWGTGERVQGWEPGLKGIRPGGIRELIVPSSLAYDEGPLVYVVEVTKIDPS